MDVILSSKPQTLSLIPCTPLSSFFSYNLRSIRRDFLGRAHALRPPAGTLRSRRKQRKPGLRVQSSRFLFRASLESHSSVLVVVVAVVTFSAVSVVLFNRFRRKKNDREVSGPPNFALLELGQDVMNWVFGGQILGFGELHKGKERNRLRDKIGESSHASEDEEGPLLLRNSALIDEEVLVTKTLLPPGSDVLTSITSDYSDTNGPVFDSCAVQPLTSAKEMTALQVEGPEEGIASDLELPTLKDNIELNGASVNINNSPAEVNAYNKANNEPAEEGKTVSDNVFLGESVREELHIFYEANESVTQSMASSSTLKSFSKHASVLNRNSALIDEEVLVTKTLLPPGSDVLTSSSSDYSDTNGPVFDSCAVQPLTFAKEMTALQVEGPEEEIASDLELPTLKDNIELNGASVNINNSPAEVNAYNKANNEPAEEGKTVSDNVFLGESVREELYIFYEANESVTQSMASSSTLKSFSKHASVLNSNKYSSSLRTSALRGAELSAQVSLQTAEHVQGKLPIACYKEGLPHRRRDSGKVNGFPRDREIRDMPLDSYKNFPQFPHPSMMQVTDKKHPSEQLSAYNRLLKEGRLTQCVELLEDMERSGLLDMNKVYHVKFFEKCKGQKAVKEAFRYAKLIPNPTLSTFNMLVSVCGSSQDSEGAFRVLPLVQEAGLKADCKLYTTLISTCAKSGKVDAMFEVFHKMVNAGVEPNVNTYGALIDGCARAGQVAKAFGAYGIMRSKKVKPDRVVFNALITACGQSGAVDRAFDVLAEMGAETQPIDPDHVTIGALIKACANAGQVDRAREVYKMIHQYHIKGTPDVYTIAVNCCSQTGDWEFACSVYNDMTRNGVVPDEMFLSALIDAAGHAGKLDAAFEILQKARVQGIQIGIVSYSSLMGACSNAKNWQKALELYEDLKSMKMKQTISTVNALITALCDGDQLPKAMEVLSEMKELGLSPNSITYSILLVASEKKDDLEAGLMVLSQAKKDGIIHNLVMCRCIVGMCLRRFEEACKLGEPVLSFDSGQPHVDNKGTSVALMMYRETIVSGVMPTNEVLSQVLGCLQFPCDASVKDKLIENLGVSGDTSRCSNLCSLIDGFGEYDPRAFSLVEEAASLGIVPCVSFKASPIVVDVRNLETHTAEVYLLTVLKGLKHRLAAGAKLPNITILLSVDETNFISPKGERTINLSGRASQAVAALLRRLGLQYQGNESYGKIRINGLSLRRWFQPKLTSPFSGKPGDWSSSQSRLGKGIIHQQRNIRTGNLSLD